MQAGWRQASVFSVGRLGLALCTEQGGRPHAAARERRCADPDCRARARGLHAFGEVLQTNLRPSRFVTRPSHTVGDSALDRHAVTPWPVSVSSTTAPGGSRGARPPSSRGGRPHRPPRGVSRRRCDLLRSLKTSPGPLAISPCARPPYPRARSPRSSRTPAARCATHLSLGKRSRGSVEHAPRPEL